MAAGKCKFKGAVCDDVIFVSHPFRSKCNNFSEFFSLFFRTFNEALFIVVHFILFFLVSLLQFRCLVLCVISHAFVSVSSYLFHLH